MSQPITPRLFVVILCAAVTPVLAPLSAVADVTLTERVSIDARGHFAVLGVTGTTSTYVSGERARVESRMKPTSGMMARFAGDMDSSMILRLDREVLWQLNPEAREYSELTFEELRAQAQDAMAQVEEMSEAGALPIDDEECRWSEPRLSVDQTGERDRFGGVRAKQTLITAGQTCTMPDTGKVCEVRWTLDYWLASKPPGGKEVANYANTMSRAFGGDDSAALIQLQARGLLAMFKKGWDDVLAETEGLDGHPVKTVMTLSLGGPACTMPGGQTIAMDEMWGSAMDAALDSAAGTAAGHAGYVAQREAAEAVGGGIGGSIAGSAVGSATRDLAGSMFRKFKNRKKDKEPEARAAPAARALDGMVNLFTISSELTDVDKGRVDAAEFEVPAGWARVEPAGS